MKLTIAVDPGKSIGGCALFLDQRLALAEVVNVVKLGEPVEHARLFGQRVAAITEAARVAWNLPEDLVVELVCEDQMVYRPRPGVRNKNPNALLWLSKALGATEACLPHAAVTRVMPGAWKASVDPDVLLEDRLPRRLDRWELNILDGLKATSGRHWHHAGDAIGLGLFAVGRVGRGLVEV